MKEIVIFEKSNDEIKKAEDSVKKIFMIEKIIIERRIFNNSKRKKKKEKMYFTTKKAVKTRTKKCKLHLPSAHISSGLYSA